MSNPHPAKSTSRNIIGVELIRRRSRAAITRAKPLTHSHRSLELHDAAATHAHASMPMMARRSALEWFERGILPTASECAPSSVLSNVSAESLSMTESSSSVLSWLSRCGVVTRTAACRSQLVSHHRTIRVHRSPSAAHTTESIRQNRPVGRSSVQEDDRRRSTPLAPSVRRLTSLTPQSSGCPRDRGCLPLACGSAVMIVAVDRLLGIGVAGVASMVGRSVDRARVPARSMRWMRVSWR
jgi:hypothetical protein